MTDKIFNEDCLSAMARIPDGSVDFVLTDLPYGLTDCDFDKTIDLAKFWEQIKRVTKHNAAIALFGAGRFTFELYNSNSKMYRYMWIWQKNLATGFLNAKRMPLRSYEEICIFYRKLPTYNPQKTKAKPRKAHCRIKTANYHNGGWLEFDYDSDTRYPLDIQKFSQTLTLPPSDRIFHPTQKPVDLLEYLIKTYTNEGELVLDATIGSGSTAVAAINTGRHFIGFETEKNFYDIALKRIEEARERLF